MYEIKNEQALQEVLARTHGYLVNIWPGREITAHDLQHLSQGCRNTVKATKAYPKYFAENAREIDQKWGNGNWKYCPNCEQSR